MSQQVFDMRTEILHRNLAEKSDNSDEVATTLDFSGHPQHRPAPTLSSPSMTLCGLRRSSGSLLGLRPPTSIPSGRQQRSNFRRQSYIYVFISPFLNVLFIIVCSVILQRSHVTGSQIPCVRIHGADSDSDI